MPVAVALIIGVVVLATALIGLLWAMAVLLPFYAYIAAAPRFSWCGARGDTLICRHRWSGRLQLSAGSMNRRCGHGIHHLSTSERTRCAALDRQLAHLRQLQSSLDSGGPVREHRGPTLRADPHLDEIGAWDGSTKEILARSDRGIEPAPLLRGARNSLFQL